MNGNIYSPVFSATNWGLPACWIKIFKKSTLKTSEENISGRTYIKQLALFLLVVYTLLSLQNLLGYFIQIRRYQKVIKKWLGKGILGIGQRRGIFIPGEILVLVYNQHDNAVITVQSMRGYSVFARFKEKSEYTGLSLEDLRLRGLKADLRDLRLWRIFISYNPQKQTRLKGALIQAVEAVEKHLRNQTPFSEYVAGLKKIADVLSDTPAVPPATAPQTVSPPANELKGISSEENHAG